MLNYIIIMGRLTRDPELRRTGSGLAVTSFSVAVERNYPDKTTGKREVDFIDCVAWREKGEFVSKWFTKGSMIVVAGRLQKRSWTDKDGNKRETAEILVENTYFVESKKDRDARENAGGSGGAAMNPPMYSAPNFSNYGGYYPVPYANPTGMVSPTPNSEWTKLEGDDEAMLPF